MSTPRHRCGAGDCASKLRDSWAFAASELAHAPCESARTNPPKERHITLSEAGTYLAVAAKSRKRRRYLRRTKKPTESAASWRRKLSPANWSQHCVVAASLGCAEGPGNTMRDVTPGATEIHSRCWLGGGRGTGIQHAPFSGGNPPFLAGSTYIAAASGVCPLCTAFTRCSRPIGVRRAFSWMFIRSSVESLKLRNSSFLAQDRMDNLLKAHS
jgi:hypothetical protein